MTDAKLIKFDIITEINVYRIGGIMDAKCITI